MMISHIILNLIAFKYIYVVKPILFLFSAETVHNYALSLGEILGKINWAKLLIGKLLKNKSKRLEQKIENVEFKNPIGLAAGFDYEAKLTQILPSLDFGFMTVGTITNNAYEGNPFPMLGRLPKSKALLVNKGFKNLGAEQTIKNLENLEFDIPVGISIGRTNKNELITQTESVQDIVNAFIKFENSKVKNSYYELNISCPNLFGNINFYTNENLTELLNAVQKLNLQKPLFIKMPIEKTEEEVLQMLNIINGYKVEGVIFGNLQKNRSCSALVTNEVLKFNKGYFSGKPTFEDSNKFIKLCYKNYKNRFVIVGCGGVFSAEDAYLKIKNGASLIQLITGLIYNGPQLVSQINRELDKLLAKDGFKNISEAVGVDCK